MSRPLSENYGIRSKGEEMPPIFKALSTITAWVLFIYGLLAIVGGLVICGMGAINLVEWLHQFVGIASLVLAVVVMRLRQGMK